jgi:heme/copper-type cytochrome/quinol oxidase subunit 2
MEIITGDTLPILSRIENMMFWASIVFVAATVVTTWIMWFADRSEYNEDEYRRVSRKNATDSTSKKD